jgi:hypothetical protein
VDGQHDLGQFDQAGHVITGNGDGGAGGRYVFVNLAELDEIISELGKLRDAIREDGDKLNQAAWHIRPPGEDVMSRIEAQATIDCLNRAIRHNRSMRDYAEAELAKMYAARGAYVSTDDEGAARLRATHGG